jgi:hypothetical protein
MDLHREIQLRSRSAASKLETWMQPNQNSTFVLPVPRFALWRPG